MVRTIHWRGEAWEFREAGIRALLAPRHSGAGGAYPPGYRQVEITRVTTQQTFAGWIPSPTLDVASEVELKQAVDRTCDAVRYTVLLTSSARRRQVRITVVGQHQSYFVELDEEASGTRFQTPQDAVDTALELSGRYAADIWLDDGRREERIWSLETDLATRRHATEPHADWRRVECWGETWHMRPMMEQLGDVPPLTRWRPLEIWSSVGRRYVGWLFREELPRLSDAEVCEEVHRIVTAATRRAQG